MTKVKYLWILFIMGILLVFMPSQANATEVKVTRNFYANSGSIKFNFTGLTLDTTHEYEYGLTKTEAQEVEKWHLITEYTKTEAIVDVARTSTDLREVMNVVEKGYITIKDKTTNTIVLSPYAVDLKIPFLQVTNYTVIPNGKSFSSDNTILIGSRNAGNSKAYYQYEKITDSQIINRYKEIKEKNGNFNDLQSILTTKTPTSNWKSWWYWNGYSAVSSGEGYTQKEITVPDTGLYYMWVYFSGQNIKDVYGYILVDNLQPEIKLESISLPKTATVELGKTLTLLPTFNPSNATNKIVTWSSSDETVATVDNAGKVTPKKLGSTIITVVSQDGNKQANCTVTVTEVSSSTDQEQENTNNSQTNNKPSDDSTTTNKEPTNIPSTQKPKEDETAATGTLPQTGVGVGLSITIIFILGIAIVAFVKYNKLRDI